MHSICLSSDPARSGIDLSNSVLPEPLAWIGLYISMPTINVHKVAN